MKRRLTSLVAVSLSALALQGCDPKPNITADRVLTNARIYTVNEDASWAEAVAIKDDRFAYVGDTMGAKAFIGDATVHSDLGGRFVMSGIIDGHTHPAMMNMESYGPPITAKQS